MPYVFVDDGFPEAADFEDNYVFVGRRESDAARVGYFSLFPRLSSSAPEAARIASPNSSSSTTP
jgi:hypothetical protein